MKFTKKIVLALSVTFSMLIALVVGLINVNASKIRQGVGNLNSNQEATTQKTYKYAPGTVSLQRGGSTLNYAYNLKNNQGDTPATVAYEYSFGNDMDRATAVNLKELDATDVNISYFWDNKQIDLAETIETKTEFECQIIPNYNDRVYIYVFVSPKEGVEHIPTSFTSKVVWYYGVPKDLSIVNNITGETTYQTVVDNQSIDKNTLIKPESFVKNEDGKEVTYYFDSWFLDKDYTQMVDADDVKFGQQVYARYANFPKYKTDYTTFENGGYTIINNPNITNLVVPSIYNDGVNGDAPIVVVKDNSFDRCDGLISIDLSVCTSLTTIEYDAFYNCTNLISVNLRNCSALTKIDRYVFQYCRRLFSIIMPSNVKSIGRDAFGYCNSLTSITLPESLTNIEENAFFECYALAEIYNLSSLNIVAGTSYKNSSNQNTYLGQYAKVVHTSLSTPSRIQDIDNVKYYVSNTDVVALYAIDKNITSHTFHSRTTEINQYAFDNCRSLTSIDLPDTLTSIGVYAFYNCSGLTSITLPSSLTSIGNYAFYYCESLTSITLPSALTLIGDYSFLKCNKLTSILIPTSVTYIGKDAFQQCVKLTSITIEGGGTWYNSTSSNYTAFNNADIIDLSNSATNVRYFTVLSSNGGYSDYYFYRKVA